MKVVHCRLCDVDYPGQAFWDGNGFELHRCPRCQFITTWPVPTREELSHYYSDEYFGHQHRGVEDWGVGRRGIFRQVAALLRAAGITGRDAVLDVGSGYGYLLRYLSSQGFRCEGVELSERCVTYHRAHCSIPVQQGVIEDLRGSACYRSILFADVFEHLPDFQDTLRVAKRLLSSDGFILIRVPNMVFHLFKFELVKKLHLPWPYEMFTVPDHLNHFTPCTLRAVLHSAGFEVQQETDGFPDLTGDRFRNGTLWSWYLIAGGLRRLRQSRPLLGNSLVVVAQKRERTDSPAEDRTNLAEECHPTDEIGVTESAMRGRQWDPQ